MKKLSPHIFLTVVLAGLAVVIAAVGIALAFGGRTAEPRLISASGDPATTAETFLNTLCSGDYSAASALCAGGLPSEEIPQDEEAAALYECMKASWAWASAGELRREGISACLPVTLTTLDISALTADMNADVNAVLARYVEEADYASDIYDENEHFRDEVVQRAWKEVWDSRLSRASEFTVTADTELTLRYGESGWIVVPDGALLNILAGKL